MSGQRSSGNLASGQLSFGQLALGTVPLGNFRVAIDDARAHATVDAAWEAGVRLFDTAPLYGSGLAERRLGEALSGRNRNDFVVSTKVGNRLDPSAPVRPDLMDDGVPIYRDIPHLQPVVDFSERAVRESLEQSIERLGVDRIDIVHLHDPQPESPHLDAAIGVLDRMRSDGLIRAIGVGGSDLDALQKIVQHTRIDFLLEAGLISVLEHDSAERISDLARSNGFRVLAAGVFNSGILAAEDPASSTYFYRRAPRTVVDRVLAIRRLCSEYEIDPIAVAMQFPLRVPGVETVVIGAASPEEMRADAAAMTATIPESFWHRLDDVPA